MSRLVPACSSLGLADRLQQYASSDHHQREASYGALGEDERHWLIGRRVCVRSYAANRNLTIMQDTSPRYFAFVLMPVSKEFEDIYVLGIKSACKRQAVTASE